MQRLRAMVRAGVDLQDALASVIDEVEDEPLASALQDVVDGLGEGRDLHECLEEAAASLGPRFTAALRRFQARRRRDRDRDDGFTAGLEGPVAAFLATLRELESMGRRIGRRSRQVRREIRRHRRFDEDGREEVEVVVRVRDQDDEADVEVDLDAQAPGHAAEAGDAAADPGDAAGDAHATFAALAAEAEEAGATDLHLEPTPGGARLRFRIDGVLTTRRTLDEDEAFELLAAAKRAAGLDPDEVGAIQDGRVILAQGDGPDDPDAARVEARVAIGPAISPGAGPGGDREAMCVRLLFQRRLAAVLEDPAQIFQPTVRDPVLRAAQSPYGLLLVSGPTGSGKTTASYALLAAQDTEGRKVVAIEDPNELQLPGVHHISIDPARGLTFETAFRHALRMNPDVIFCGELRDFETVHLMMQAALTGHLVIACMHAPSAPEAIVRLLNIGVEPYLIAEALIGVVSQRLVRKLDPDQAIDRPQDLEDLARLAGGEAPADAHPKGPPEGSQGVEGYRGRVAVQEYLAASPELRRRISQKADLDALVEVAREAGYRTMRENAAALVAAGVTSVSEARRSCGPR